MNNRLNENNIDKLNNTLELIATTFNELEEVIKKILQKSILKLDLYDVIDIYSQNIDKIIINSIDNEKLRYIGGNLIVIFNNEVIEFKTECYFQDMNKNWVRKNNINNLETSRFTENSIKELIINKQLKFDIVEPKRG